MRSHSKSKDVKDFLSENEIICQKKQANVQQCVSSTTCYVPEGLQWHQLPERRIEKINKIDYKTSQHQVSFAAREGSVLSCTFAPLIVTE